MDVKIFSPKFSPESRLIDLPKSNHQPVDKPLITPPSSYMFDPVDYPAEGTLDRIGGHGNPAFPLQPEIKNQKGVTRKILDIGSGLRVFLGIQRFYQMSKALFNILDQLRHQFLAHAAVFVLLVSLHLGKAGSESLFFHATHTADAASLQRED